MTRIIPRRLVKIKTFQSQLKLVSSYVALGYWLRYAPDTIEA